MLLEINLMLEPDLPVLGILDFIEKYVFWPLARGLPTSLISTRTRNALHRFLKTAPVLALPGSSMAMKGTPCIGSPSRGSMALMKTEDRFSPDSAPYTYST